jgi:hypothetical protein
MIGAILTALAEFLKWRRIAAEIEARRLLYDELQRIDDSVEDLGASVAQHRAAGDHELADRLLRRQARAVLYRAGLPALEGGGDVHGPT